MSTLLLLMATIMFAIGVIQFTQNVEVGDSFVDTMAKGSVGISNIIVSAVLISNYFIFFI